MQLFTTRTEGCLNLWQLHSRKGESQISNLWLLATKPQYLLQLSLTSFVLQLEHNQNATMEGLWVVFRRPTPDQNTDRVDDHTCRPPEEIARKKKPKHFLIQSIQKALDPAHRNAYTHHNINNSLEVEPVQAASVRICMQGFQCAALVCD